MPDSKIAVEEAVASRDSESPHGRPSSTWFDDFSNSGWPSIMLGIVLAGASYPVLLGAAYAAAGVALEVWSQPEGLLSLEGLMILFGSLLLFMVVFTVFGGIVGAMWTSIVAFATLPVMHLFLWSLNLRGRIFWLGAVYGGLVGFLTVLPITLRLPDFLKTGEAWSFLALLAAGPGLATPLAQFGGAWGARRAVQRASAKAERHRTLVALGWRAESPRWLPSEAIALNEAEPIRLQFGIRHLLWISVWLSLLLSVIRLSGIPFEFILPLLVGWLVYQGATLWVGWRLGRWWQARRQVRST